MQQQHKPPSTSLLIVLEFLRMLMRLLLASTIADDNRTGREGEWKGGGEYNRECLLDNDRDNNEYNNNDKTMTQRMGRGCMGEWTIGGCNSPFIATTACALATSPVNHLLPLWYHTLLYLSSSSPSSCFLMLLLLLRSYIRSNPVQKSPQLTSYPIWQFTIGTNIGAPSHHDWVHSPLHWILNSNINLHH